MSDELRDEHPGFHHVTCRGNNKRLIVLDDLDRFDFFGRLRRTVRRHGWQIVTYCLMDNHYHLVMEIGERGMSDGFCELHTGYATEFNRRHGRVNHLFGKRYWNGRLEGEDALVAACRYVLFNPVRAGLVSSPADWEWSSYRATVGEAFPHVPLAIDALLCHFGATPEQAVEAFRDFMFEPVPKGHDPRQPV